MSKKYYNKGKNVDYSGSAVLNFWSTPADNRASRKKASCFQKNKPVLFYRHRNGNSMKYFIKFEVVFLLVILFPFIGMAAEMEEKGLRVSPPLSREKVTQVKIMIDSADGGPKVHTLQLGYPASTVLVTAASLTVKKGSYKIELLGNDKPAVTLSAQNGKTVKAEGRLNVSAEGAVQYRVTAKKAKGVAFDLSFNPYQEEVRGGSVDAEEKLSLNGDSIKLKLTCVAGKDCLLRVQNLSPSKACRNIFFRIDYKIMTRTETVEKNKSGIIEDILPPGKAGEWPVGLVFGEPPKDMKIAVIKADAVDAVQVTAPFGNLQKSGTIELLPIAPLSGEVK